jgi:hypothetical protein
MDNLHIPSSGSTTRFLSVTQLRVGKRNDTFGAVEEILPAFVDFGFGSEPARMLRRRVESTLVGSGGQSQRSATSRSQFGASHLPRSRNKRDVEPRRPAGNNTRYGTK